MPQDGRYRSPGGFESANSNLQINPTPGRPLLHWLGKRPLRSVKYYPAQLKEQHGQPGEDGWVNRLYWGDNLQVMSHLMPEFRGRIKLIYLDPPFDSKADYRKRIKVKGREVEGHLSVIEEKQYTDMWANDLYLQFMYERLQLIRELLADDGSVYVHMDYRRGHYIKIILDEVFGPSNFRNEIIVRRATKNLQGQFEEIAMLNAATDSIFWYSKNPHTRFRPHLKASAENQRKGTWAGFYNHEDRPTMRYEIFGKNITTGQWKWKRERAYRAAANYQEYVAKYQGQMTLEEYWEKTGKKLEFLRPNPSTGNPEYWVEPRETVPCDTNWLDIPAYSYATGYPTEKSEALLERIIAASSDPGDLVADFFCGSGTTLAVAQKLGRRWIGSDINWGAIHTTAKRIGQIIRGKGAASKGKQYYPGFAIYNVNHYDIFKNNLEAKEIVMKLYGVKPVQRSFFDGILGDKWVKVVDLNRVCTKQDIQAVIDEVVSKNKYDSGDGLRRGVIILCSGHEHDVLDYAKRANVAHISIEIRDILVDHKEVIFKRPPEAKIHLKHENGKAFIAIHQFYSPTLLQKLSLEDDPEEIVDWRQTVEAVFIDPDYDGEVFRPAIQDVPQAKEMVAGIYEVPITRSGQKIAVKIVDVLADEYFEVLGPV